MKHISFWLLLGSLVTSCTTTKTIVERPITFNEERKILTLEYLENRYGLEQDAPQIYPKMIVLHWTVIPTFEKSFEAFDPATLPNWRPDIKDVSGLNVSSQFMVDRDGTIYQLLPETTMARHVIGLNHCAIGVENVGGTDELPLTKAQLKSNIWLVRYLKEKYDIDYLIGHYEYTLFENNPLWLEKDEGYRTKKTDPGPDFMFNVRKAVKDLKFKELPENPSK
ncbi:N-acetylmuramoyl-L-alanine amidase [Maribacter sp. ACAM166]|uniref:N-acetylmuramoyl-L-alanine amidase n=1 Tax=Maribacter sp. ACAM166 TaxID=2508996 RepID=UPI0010FDE814|nr:peptidoglycan recognition family protein [Maribacter sp. ACAM166]TLP79201.1 N-acetylmuramoyl-L-alanine amidase [Maribacter sp. ACAM166]